MTEAEHIARAAAALDDTPAARSRPVRPAQSREGEKK